MPTREGCFPGVLPPSSFLNVHIDRMGPTDSKTDEMLDKASSDDEPAVYPLFVKNQYVLHYYWTEDGL